MKCSKCSATGVKLWRQYSTFLDHIELLCTKHAEEDQKLKWDRESDAIGWLVAAVPTEDGKTFWGYSSVPYEDCLKWYKLPSNNIDKEEVIQFARELLEIKWKDLHRGITNKAARLLFELGNNYETNC